MEKIKGILVTQKDIRAKEIEKSLDSYYKNLNCDTIDIVSIRIGSKNFDVICDDEALLKEDPVPAIINYDETLIYGNCFIVNFDGVDDVTDLTDDEIALILKRVRRTLREDSFVIIADSLN